MQGEIKNELNLNRETLQAIREVAVREANVDGLNDDWQRAYQQLADATSKLDAYVARSEL